MFFSLIICSFFFLPSCSKAYPAIKESSYISCAISLLCFQSSHSRSNLLKNFLTILPFNPPFERVLKCSKVTNSICVGINLFPSVQMETVLSVSDKVFVFFTQTGNDDSYITASNKLSLCVVVSRYSCAIVSRHFHLRYLLFRNNVVPRRRIVKLLHSLTIPDSRFLETHYRRDRQVPSARLRKLAFTFIYLTRKGEMEIENLSGLLCNPCASPTPYYSLRLMPS